MKAPRLRVVVKIADPYAHVPLNMAWHSDGHADSQDGVGDSQSVEVAIAQK